MHKEIYAFSAFEYAISVFELRLTPGHKAIFNDEYKLYYTLNDQIISLFTCRILQITVTVIVTVSV